MAARSTILVLGDLTAAGQRPSSELSAISPSFVGPQSGISIWTGSAWATLNPGVNTNPNAVSTTFWGVESRIVPELESRLGSSAPRFIVKHAVSSMMALGRDYPSWVVGDSPEVFTAARNAIAAAAVAAGGDTLRIDAIVLSIQTWDFRRSSTAKSVGALFRQLIASLRDAGTYSGPVTLGSIRPGESIPPIAIIEPHYSYAGLSVEEKMQLNQVRMIIQGLECEADRVTVVRSEQTTSSDGLTYSALSMVDLAGRCAAALLAPEPAVDGSNAVARMVLEIGDNVLDGTALNTSLPPHQQGALTGAMVWSPYTGSFVTLQAGTNNQNSTATTDNGFGGASAMRHGPEIAVMDALRSTGEVFLVKGCVTSSFAAANLQKAPLSLPPTFDQFLHTWSPGARDQLWDLTIRGWLRSAIAYLRRSSRKPKIELVVVCVGTNDLLLRDTTPEAVDSAVQDIVSGVKRVAAADNVDIASAKFVVCVPSQGLSASPSVIGTELDTLRNEMLALPNAAMPGVGLIDLSDISTQDLVHPDAAGNAELARRIVSIYQGGSQAVVAPMFVPTMDDLRKSLRLSSIATTSDAIAMIDAAVQTASVTFFRHLGQEKIALIKATAYTRAPVTNMEFLRVLAASTELKIVRAQLLRNMPLMFMDGAIPARSWQEEAAFREGSTLMHRDEMKRLDEEIRQALATLQSAQFSAGGDLATSVVSPDSSIVPGQTISASVF